MLLFLIILIIEAKTFSGLSPTHPAIILSSPKSNIIDATVTGARTGFDSQTINPGATLQDLTLTNSLTVLGSTLFGKTSIAGGLTIDGSLALGAQGLQSLGDTLYVEQNKLAAIDFMRGALRINTDGLVIISDTLKVQGVLGASTIMPVGDGLTVDLTRVGSNSANFGNLLVKGSASFSGNIESSGSGTFARLVSPIIETSKLIFTPSGQAGSIGLGTIPAGFATMNILTNAVTVNSHVFVTPISLTREPISVTQLIPPTLSQGGSFTVETAIPVSHDIDFSWFIVN